MDIEIKKYQEIEGDLIKLALEGNFDVIAHGCNCFCTMKRGIAPQIAFTFGCNVYPLEHRSQSGNINKLGNIEFDKCQVYNGIVLSHFNDKAKWLTVVNAYTQFNWESNNKPLDYDALTLCMRKINYIFKGKHIGLPQIGCGLAGGDWNKVKSIIQEELKDCNVTIVIYKPE
jgi:O-acetyl-ADP-ribose deacetylase (regulator of RNase III)